MVEFYPTAFQIRDLAVLPTEPAALETLLGVVAQEAQACGIPQTVRLFVPREAWIEAILQRLFGNSLRWGEDAGQVMARPINRQFSEQDLDRQFRAPDGLFSSLDLF